MRQVQTRSVGDLTVRIMGLERIRNFVVNDLINLIVSLIVIVPVLVNIYLQNPTYALILMSLITMTIVINILYSKHLYKISLVENFHLADHRGNINESLKEHYFIKVTGIYDKIRKKWNDSYKNYLRVVNKRMVKQYTFESLNSSLSTISMILFLIIGFYDFTRNQVSLSNVFFFITMASIAFGPVTKIVSSIINWNAIGPIMLRVQDVFEETADNEEVSQNIKLEKNNISFEAISYEIENTKILDNINLEINANESIAIFGKSGSGKSTLANILMKVHKPTSGKVMIGGDNIENINSNGLRKNIGLMTQDGVLFSSTLLENLSIFDVMYNPLEIQSYINKLNLGDYLQFKSINDITIAESGRNFSGGQRQRLAMLRLFLKKYPILVLDEPTNHLDKKTGDIIIDNIFSVTATKIIITHDERVLKKADKVFELINGQLVLRRDVENGKVESHF